MADKDVQNEAEASKEGGKAGEEHAAADVKKLPFKLFIAIALALILASIGGVYFVLSGSDASADVQEGPVDPQAIYFALQPKFKTNHQVDGRPRLFQIGMTLVTREQDVIDALMVHGPSIKSRLMILLSGQQVENLQTPEGRELLRAECLTAVQAIMNIELGKPGIEKVLFTDFVMQ